MIEYLIRKNHRWEDIIDGYSINTVRNFFKAGRENDKIDHIQLVSGLSLAVINALDVSLNKGKAKVLETYFKSMEKEKLKKVSGPKGTIVGKSAMAFFNSLPKRGPDDGG